MRAINKIIKKMQDFYRDKNINTRDKHTFIKVYHEFKADREEV